jgi:hypothetical protein
MANTFKFGNGKWAVKDGAALAYNDENNNFKPLPFDFTRASSATRVNREGLIKVVGQNKPRIDFTDNTSGHLLLEPSRKNDITDYTGASFSAFNGATITANDSNSPDGSSNATLMTTTGGANELIQQASITILSGQSYTVSGYFKLKSGTLSDPDNAFKGLDGLNGGGITGSTFNSSITNEWQRLSFTVTSSTTSGRVQIKCEDAAEILVWGLQVEQGSYATSIIKTEGSAVTRSAEEANSAGNSNVFNDSEGVLYVETSKLSTSDNGAVAISNGSYTHRVVLYFDNSGNVRGQVYSSGEQANIITSGLDYTQNNKFALKYSATSTKFYVNGSQVGSTDTSSTMPVGLSELAFDDGGGGSDFYGNIKDVRVYDTALTDSELQALTS